MGACGPWRRSHLLWPLLSISAAVTVFGATSGPLLRRGAGASAHRPHIYTDPCMEMAGMLAKA